MLCKLEAGASSIGRAGRQSAVVGGGAAACGGISNSLSRMSNAFLSGLASMINSIAELSSQGPAPLTAHHTQLPLPLPPVGAATANHCRASWAPPFVLDRSSPAATIPARRSQPAPSGRMASHASLQQAWRPSACPCSTSRQRCVVAKAAGGPNQPAPPLPPLTRRGAGALLGSLLLAPGLASTSAPAAAALTLEDVTPAVAPPQALTARCGRRRLAARAGGAVGGSVATAACAPSLLVLACLLACLLALHTFITSTPTCRESAIADIYDRTAPSIANVYDVTLRMVSQAGGPQAVEQPEGNGSGFVWDTGGLQACFCCLY